MLSNLVEREYENKCRVWGWVDSLVYVRARGLCNLGSTDGHLGSLTSMPTHKINKV